jgi:predicted lipoprotein with Yx(FWY)xxD motif
MTRSSRTAASPRRTNRVKRSVALLAIGVSGFALAAVAGIAVAKSFTLGAAKNVSVKGKKESIVVNSKGLTVYDLIPETTRRALCKSSNGCLSFWFPVTVSSAKAKLSAAPGVKGKLGTWQRNGFLQVTLGGHPLYTFKLDDKKRGKATGEGIASFGGTWHVLRASTGKKSTNTPSTSTSTTTTGMSPGTGTTPCLYPPCH